MVKLTNNIMVKIVVVAIVASVMLMAEPIEAKRRRSKVTTGGQRISSPANNARVNSAPRRGNAKTKRQRAFTGSKINRTRSANRKFSRNNTTIGKRRHTKQNRAVKRNRRQNVQTFSQGVNTRRPSTPATSNRSQITINNRAVKRQRRQNTRAFGQGVNFKRHSTPAISNSSRITINNRSRFTKPANRKSMYTRPARERSQYIKRTNSGIVTNNTRINRSPAKRSVRQHRSSRDKYFHNPRPHRRRRHRTFRRSIWPRRRHLIYYNYGPRFTFRYVYPYHHRKYVFISLGGYWPTDYRYLRYYWYDYHPYRWYGYAPSIYEVQGDTYNYYYYNSPDSQASGTSYVPDDVVDVDENTFADVREKLAAEKLQQPNGETAADRYFDEAVKAFESGDHRTAAYKFSDAINLEPDDKILPFAYVQALFADQQYREAAEVLRDALPNVPSDEQGVFFPRGLYENDQTLFAQIDTLAEEANSQSWDNSLQLLLGYQLLGAGKLDEAAQPLGNAKQSYQNQTAATILLDLIEKIKLDNPESITK